MRRAALLAALCALLLVGCGAPAGPEPALSLGLLGEPIGAAPALLGEDALPLPLRLAHGDEALRSSYLIAPSALLPSLAGEGWIALGAACLSPPDALLWHRGALFSWRDLRKAPLYVAPGADEAALHAAVERYAGILSPLPVPSAEAGGVDVFLRDETGFLLAPEPLATQLVADGKAELAQALPDELGPYPSCLLLARRSAIEKDPLLTLQVVRALDLGLWRLATEDAGQIALRLRPLAPTAGATHILRAVLAARAERVFSQAVYLTPSLLQELQAEFARGDLPQGAVDQGPARRALRDPFR